MMGRKPYSKNKSYATPGEEADPGGGAFKTTWACNPPVGSKPYCGCQGAKF